MKIFIEYDTAVGPVDYTNYVIEDSLTITDSINVPTTVNFNLIATNEKFVVPKRSSYVRIVSEVYAQNGGYLTPGQTPYANGKVLATGFITTELERQYLGLNEHVGYDLSHFQALTYVVQVTSDEWLLNTKFVPFIPAFINQTQGQILANLALALRPDFEFDVTTFVASGDLIPYYSYDPTQTWSDIAKTFADSSRYRYKVIDKKVYFEPFGDQPLGISYDEATQRESQFDPLSMSTGVITVPPVNDAMVLGQEEPQTQWDNYFVGDGFTSNFQLLYSSFRGSGVTLQSDDWTEDTFDTSQWNVQDPLNQFALAGALNVLQAGEPESGLGVSYIVSNNGVEIGGAINVQVGEFEFLDTCTGIVGGLYTSSDLQASSCFVGFNVTTASGDLIVTASGAGGILIQPMLFGEPFGTVVETLPNHHYQLQIWVGGNRWDRYNSIYRNINGTESFGGDPLAAFGQVTWVIGDIDEAVVIANAYGVQSLGAPVPVVPVLTKTTVTNIDMPEFGIFAPINAVNLNLALNYTLVAQPPQGTLNVQSISGASGGLLPVLPANLTPYQHFLLGTGFENQTATITQSGSNDQLSFYDDTIPGVGSRIRFMSWADGTAMARVRNSAAIAVEAAVSGDDGVRSAIFTNLSPSPRTSDECELAAAATITDRSYPQFQGNYQIFSIPFYFEKMFNASASNYPVSGRYLFVNAPVRAVSGQNFFVNTVTTQVIELKQEILQIGVSYGPDLYLEKTLQNFVERTDKLLTSKETTKAPTPVELENAGSNFITGFENAQVLSVVNSLTGNFVTVDLGAPPVTAAEVRRADTGWGSADANLVGIFTTQQFNLPRYARDQTWFIRPRNGLQTSRFSYAARVQYPLIPSPPKLVAETTSGFVLDYNGDVRDIYAVEIRIPAITGSSGVILPISHTPPTTPTDSTMITQLVRSALVRPGSGGQQYNVLATYNSETVSIVVGDVIQVTCPTDVSFNGLKVITFISGNRVGWFDRGQPFPDQVGNNSNTIATSLLYAHGSVAQVPVSGSILGGVATLYTAFAHGMNVGDAIMVGTNWLSSTQSPPSPYNQDQDSAVFTGVFVVTATPTIQQLQYQLAQPDVVATPIIGIVVQLPSGTIPDNPTSSDLANTNTTTLFRRPVFAPSDLSFDLTDSRVQQVLGLVTTFAQGGGIPFFAYFFNLTWDYSLPLDLVDVVAINPASGSNVLAIAQLAIDDSSKICSWIIAAGKPDGYRVTISDQVTNQTYDQFTLDNPSNPQPLTQFTMTDADFYPPRNVNVTPFNSLGDGIGETIAHSYSPGASGGSGGTTGGTTVSNTSGTYTIGCTFNGLIPSQYILTRVPFDQHVTFYQNMVPSQGWIDIPPTTEAMVISIQKIAASTLSGTAPPYILGTEFATLTFNIGNCKGVFSSTAQVDFAIGDVLKAIAPIATTDGVGLGFTLSGTKTFVQTDANGNVITPVQPGTIQLLLADDNESNWQDFIPSLTIDLSIIGLDLRDQITLADAFVKNLIVASQATGDQMVMSDGFAMTLS